jgi:hypothetical protein
LYRPFVAAHTGHVDHGKVGIDFSRRARRPSRCTFLAD